MKGGKAEICSVMAKKVCLLPGPLPPVLAPRTRESRPVNFSESAANFLLGDCMSILPIPRPSFGPRFLPEQNFLGAQIWPPIISPSVAMLYGTNARPLVAEDLLFRQTTKQRRSSESVVASYSLCQTYHDKAQGLISA
jgi:hypothetical protein